jgi:hypothetical protein
VVSSIRLTIILGRSSPDFTWYYVPLGAYSVFEPLGGILCTNLPIIWHMLRKRRAANRIDSGTTKTHTSNDTPTIGSGRRHSRLMLALGITTTNKSHNDSSARTITEGEGGPGADFHRLESLESQKPDPNIWTTVEKLNTDGTEPSSSNEEVQLKPGMKKTTWNVRK